MTVATLPPGWKTVRLGEVTTVTRGASPRPISSPRWFSDASDVGWVRISDVSRSDRLTLRRTTQRLSPDGVARSKFLPPGTLIMSIAATVGLPIVTGIPACIHDGFVAIERLRGIDQRFLLYVLKSSEAQLRSAGQTGSQANINTDIVKGLKIAMPSVSEQRRIAAALRSADDLIISLAAAIAKKQAIEQGVMQQLLTGKTRLPGFSGPRETWRMRDLGSAYGGLTGKAKDDFGRGRATFVTFLDVIKATRLTGRPLERVRVHESERQNRVMRGDLLFNGSSETPEDVALSAVVAFDPSPTTYLNSFCFGYRIKRLDLADPTYLAYFFRSRGGRDIIASLAQGATRYNIAKTKFLELAPVLPDPDEQRAIVAVLNDFDNEIVSLRSRLAKAKAIKQGMMQELLTGRTRLPTPEGSV